MNKKQKNIELGSLGEQLAASYLCKKGYKIVQTNYLCRQGEIDIIALDRDELVIVEVKLRNKLDTDQALETITYKKRARITKATLNFLNTYPEYDIYPKRFDAITITKHKYFDEYSINHYIDVFDPVFGHEYIQ